MSLKSRITQNKPQREEQKAKELSDLKRQNQQLKRQISRLRKQISRLIEVHGLDIKVEDEEPVEVVEEKVEEAGGCEKCGGEIKELELAGKKFIVCTVCNWRKKQ